MTENNADTIAQITRARNEAQTRLADLETAQRHAQMELRDLGLQLQAAQLERDSLKLTGPIGPDTSDGYHTFAELYRFRMLYNAALFNEWAAAGRYDVHKSLRHSDGELCFGGGWFVVYAQLPSGQISNHYELADWEMFRIPARETPVEWDGHTSPEVATRLAFMLDVQARAAQRELRETPQ